MKKILLSLVAVLCSTFAMAEGYSINFKSTQGDWTINDVVKPDGISYVWAQSSSYGMKASAYVSGTRYATESWLVSPAIELTKSADATAVTLKFNQAGKYFDNAATDVTTWVSTDATNWTQLTMSAILDGSSWNYVETTCDLTSYAGKTVYVGFKYTSTESAAATWEISDVAIEGIDYSGTTTPTVDITNTPETAYTVSEALDLITAGQGLDAKVYVKGTVTPDGVSFFATYGDVNYYITDGTNNLYIYACYYLENGKFTSEDQLQDGDEVIVYGLLTTYNGTSEMKSCYLYSLNGKTENDTEEPDEPEVTVGGVETFENGGFETWASDSEATGWKSTTSASSATLSKSTDAHSGSYSCCIANATSNKRLGSKEFKLPAGWYTFSFYAKSATETLAEARPGYAPWDEAKAAMGTYAYGDYTAALSQTEWTLVTYTFELTAETQINLVVMNPKSSDKATYGDLLVDDAEFRVATDAEINAASINAVNAETTNGNLYNVAGQRVSENYKGIVIMNGKKFMK